MKYNFDLNRFKGYENIIILGHKQADFDSIVSGLLLEYVLKMLNINAKFTILDNYIDTEFYKLAKKMKFPYTIGRKIDKDSKLLLVDHTDSYEQEVIGCIDHHPTVVNIEKNYLRAPATSCAKLIYDIATEQNIKIPKEYTILVIYSCFFDSLSFMSTKALKEDKEWCIKKIEEYGLDYNQIKKTGFGFTDKKLPLEKYLKNGEKAYKIANKLIKSSYIVVEGSGSIDINEKEIKEIFEKELNDEVIAWCFIISQPEYDEAGRTIIKLLTKDFYLSQEIDKLLSRGKDIIPAIFDFYSFKNDGSLTKMLIDNKTSIATMESCTSGLIASNITDYEGASSIFIGSHVTYCNETKVMAGVPEGIIFKYGVYSKETAYEMAFATFRNYRTDYNVGITGSFSNVDPANKDSVAGTIYYCILHKMVGYPITLIYNNLDITRKEIKQKTVDIVLASVFAMVNAEKRKN